MFFEIILLYFLMKEGRKKKIKGGKKLDIENTEPQLSGKRVFTNGKSKFR